MARYIEVAASDGTISRTRIDSASNRFSVRPGESFKIIDDNGNVPPGLIVKRYDNHLIIDNVAEPGQPASEQANQVELIDFYGVCSVANPCQVEVREGSADSAPVTVSSSSQPIGALADGSFILYDGSSVAPTAAPVAGSSYGDGDSTDSGNSALTWGLIGAGVLGLALAAGGGGGGSDSPTAVSPSPPSPGPTPAPTPGPTPTPAPTPGGTPAPPAGDTTPPNAPTISPIAGATGVVTLAAKAAGLTVSGTGEPGATVEVRVDGYTARGTVAATGAWQVTIPSAQVGEDGTHTAVATLTDAAGNVSQTASQSYTVSTGSRVIAVADDGLVSQVEHAQGFSVVGTGPTGAPAGTTITVTLTAGGTQVSHTVTTDANNGWVARFTAADALPDGTYTVSATAIIGGVTGSTGTSQVIIDQTPPPAPAVSPVTGDNIVSGTDIAAGVTISGAGGEPGSRVTVSIGNESHVAVVAADGTWTTAAFSAAAFPADGVGTVTAVATDAAGNRGATSQAGFLILSSVIDAPAPAPATTPTVGALTLDALVQGDDPSAVIGEAAPAPTTVAPTAATIVNSLLDDPGSTHPG